MKVVRMINGKQVDKIELKQYTLHGEIVEAVIADVIKRNQNDRKRER